jgi:glutathione synthase/RimK-type ligase-like ATP-grasp enzyme
MSILILTDIPEWVRPLVDLLESRGIKVQVADDPEEILANGLIVNRVSSLLAERDKARADRIAHSLRTWEAEGRSVINGSLCFQTGYSKLAQAKLFTECGVRTPQTCPAVPGGRAINGQAVLLKPPAGGFGRGIRRLEDGEPAPDGLFNQEEGWIEQELLTAADGCVHRIEVLGSDILYEARSLIQADEFNYCLADPKSDVTLRSPRDIAPKVTESVKKILRAARMELGAVEYLLDQKDNPVFIDLNPVSSFHPGATAVLGRDPLDATASYLIHRSAGPSRYRVLA